MENNINIFSAVDNGYAQHLAVMMSSVLVNANKKDKYCFYVFDFDILDENKTKIEALKKIHSFSIEYIKLTNEQLIKLEKIASFAPTANHINVSTYSRLIIAETYPNLDKCLWLDVDVVVNEDVANLYNIDIKSNAIGGVQEIWSESERFKENLGLDISSIYINAGILVIDLKEVRKIDILYKLYEIDKIRSIKKYITLGDQDVINLVFEGNIYKLPFKYNMQRSIFEGKSSLLTNFYTKEELKIASKNYKNSGIVHYTGGIKPWNPIKQWKNKKVWSLYWYYIKFTPYSNNRFNFLFKSIGYEFSSIFYKKNKSFISKFIKILIKYAHLSVLMPKYTNLIYKNKK